MTTLHSPPIGYWRYQSDYYGLMLKLVKRGPNLDIFRISDTVLKRAMVLWEYDEHSCLNRYCSNDKVIDPNYIGNILGFIPRLYCNSEMATFPSIVYKMLYTGIAIGEVDDANINDYVRSIIKDGNGVLMKSGLSIDDLKVIYGAMLGDNNALYLRGCEILDDIKRSILDINNTVYFNISRKGEVYDRIPDLNIMPKATRYSATVSADKQAKLLSVLEVGKWYTNHNGHAVSILTPVSGITVFDKRKNTGNYLIPNEYVYRRMIDRLLRFRIIPEAPSSEGIVVVSIPYEPIPGINAYEISVSVTEYRDLEVLDKVYAHGFVLSGSTDINDLFYRSPLSPIFITDLPGKFWIASSGYEPKQIRTLPPFREFKKGDVIFPIGVRKERCLHTRVGMEASKDFFIVPNEAEAKRISKRPTHSNGIFKKYMYFLEQEKTRLNTLK